MILFGQTVLSINNQGEVLLPHSTGAAMLPRAFITQGFDRNLLLMSSESFERLYSYIKGTSISDPLARLLVRMFLGNAVELELDATGKIQIPPVLQKYIGASDEIILVGQGDYFEIWTPLAWAEQSKSIGDYKVNVDRFAKFNLADV